MRIGTFFWGVPGGVINFVCSAMRHDFISVILGNIILPEVPLREMLSVPLSRPDTLIFLRSQMHTGISHVLTSPIENRSDYDRT